MAGKKGYVIQESAAVMSEEARIPKVTFDAIYKDFRRRHPNLAKEVIHWKPRDVLKITIYMSDGMIIIYDYYEHRATICSANWKRDHLSIG